MRKIILSTVVGAAALFAASAPAFAGWYDVYGFYHPTCVYNYYYGTICR